MSPYLATKVCRFRFLFSLAWLAILMPGLGTQVRAALKIRPAPIRFNFKIDPKTALKDLLPVPPEVLAPPSSWLVDNLGQVPEIKFQKWEIAKPKKPADTNDQDVGKIAHGIAKINHLNAKGADHFLKVLLGQRPDLGGLPFVMGDACRMGKKTSKEFFQEVAGVRKALEGPGEKKTREMEKKFWSRWEEINKGKEAGKVRIATLMQILAPESVTMRQGLVKYLSGIKTKEASRALARLAIFSLEKEVRGPALEALKDRPPADYRDILRHGLHYPWPAFARHATEAMVQLQLRDWVGELIDFLDSPEPRAPVVRTVGGRKVTLVREVVRLNHFQSCLLCHPPGNTAEVKLDNLGRATEIVTGAVPVPGQRIASGFQVYDPFSSPDIHVRADVTYLRQDFSLMQQVKDADPWPKMQRFDFLVRSREIDVQEAEAHGKWLKNQGSISLHHQAVQAALRQLTGLDAEPNSGAWKKVLAHNPK